MNNDFDKTARERATAHLCDLAGIAFRNGDAEQGRTIAGCIRNVLAWDDPVDFYRAGLRNARLAPEDIDAAVAAVLRGEHPATSLMGIVAKMRDDAQGRVDVGRRNDDEPEELNGVGAVDAMNKVLDLLKGEGHNVTTARPT